MSASEHSIVGGERMERSIADFVRACEAHILTAQRVPVPNVALIAVLADAVRLSREFCRIATDDAYARGIEDAAKVCDAMVVGGRAWTHEQTVAGQALLEAASRIRALATKEGR